MKFYLLFIFFIFSINFSLAQQSEDFKNAEEYYKTANYVQAIDLYEKVLIKETKSSYVYGQIAFSYLFLEKYDEAKLNFTEAIIIDPKISDYYNGRGLAQAYLGDVNSAIGDFTKSIELDPKFSYAYLNRGSAYTSTDNIDAAISDLNVAAKLDDKNPEINFQLGRLYSKKNEYDKVVENYTIAEKKGLKSEDFYLSRASVYYKIKDLENAIKDYGIVLKINPKNTNALNNRAVMYDELGKNNLAEKDRKELYKITGVEFKDPATYEYTAVKSKNGLFTVSVPSHWDVENEEGDQEDRMIITVPQKDANPRFQTVSITLSYNYNMGEKYGVSNEDALVSFWQESQKKNTESYKQYDLISQKQFAINGWKAINFTTTSQTNENTFKLNMNEVVLTKQDQLFYGYFQSASEDFIYYEPMFERIMKSIVINPK